jgi:hypothetical protein
MSPVRLLDSLNDLRRKIRLMSLAYGLGLVVAAGIGLILGLALLDYLLNLPGGPRFVLLLVAIVALAWVAVRFIIRPLSASFTLRDVASRMERAFPVFDDRLRSTVDFIERKTPGSDAMKDRVIAETARLAGQVNLNQALVYKPVWYSMGMGAAAVGLLVMLSLLLPAVYRDTAWSRLFSPFGGAAWPKQTAIAVVGDVPARVPVGYRIPVRMHLSKGDKPSAKATIYYQYEGGGVQKELMTRGPDGQYAASLDARLDGDARQGNLRVWIESGDDRVNLQPIAIVPRLQIERVEAIVTPPSYAQQRATRTDLSAAPAVMTLGSDVQLLVHFNKQLDARTPIQILPIGEGKPPALNWQAGENETHVGRAKVHQSLQFHIKARDVDGFENSALEEFQWIVRPDQQPMVQIELPRSNQENTPQAIVPLQAVTEDDYGIRSLKLMVERLGDKKQWEIELLRDAKPLEEVGWTKIDSPGDRQRYRTNWEWELAQLKDAELKSGDVLEYHLLATDNYELDGQFHAPVPSGKLRITIISQQEFTTQVANQLLTEKQRIIELKKVQDATRGETTDLAESSKDKPQFDAADAKAAERLANQQSTAAAQAKQTAQSLNELQKRMEDNRSEAADLKQMARDVEDVLNKTAENPMKEAANSINSARQQNGDPQDRNQKLDNASKNQQQASEQLGKALKQMANIGSLETTIQEVAQIIKEQQRIAAESRELANRNLGKKPEQMKPEDRKKLEELTREQGALSERTQKAIDKMKEDAKAMEKSDPSTADTMKQSAQTGEQQAVPSRQQQAQQAMKQNQQSQAGANQKAAEMGLQLMLDKLREAERRKLEELARKLAELEQLVAELIRRQAGHNLDNLALQGGEVLAKLETKLRDDLIAKARRDKGHPTPEGLTLTNLGTGQEQTERNTRDIAKQADEMQDGAEIANRLVGAAGQMEAAIVHLREKKLPDAYEPHQVEALAKLEEAAQLVDKQKREAEKELDDQKKETIREKYVEIRRKQHEEINQPTTATEKKRNKEGLLPRLDEVKLKAELAGKQADLAGQIEALEEDLSALKSIVYIWANKDIAESMNGVKDDLTNARSGAATQMEQARIVEQLDAMIEHLKETPPDPEKFADRQGGGGGEGQGQGGPQLPSEAELKLLKSLQQSVNGVTKKLDVPEKDKEALVALGQRQGEMRDLLDQLLQRASQGQVKLGPEPDNRDALPEEANEEDIETDELTKQLLTGELTDESVNKDVGVVGDRMARSRQRLALNHDPGKVTQKIQERIIINLDEMIEASKKQQQQQQQTAGGKPQQQQPKPDDGQQPRGTEQAAQPNQSDNAAQQSTTPGSAKVDAQPDLPLDDVRSSIVKIAPRLRGEAIIEGNAEQPIEKYKGLTEDYYRGVATKAAEGQ